MQKIRSMRKRFTRLGFTPNQVEKEERAKQGRTTTTTTTTTTAIERRQSPRGPVYAKIHQDYLSVDTLKYYNIPWEYDRYDKNYIIIMREMDKYETEVLFEHTKRLRSSKLLLEPAKEDKKYGWYRKRDPSSSRARKVGILEFK